MIPVNLNNNLKTKIYRSPSSIFHSRSEQVEVAPVRTTTFAFNLYPDASGLIKFWHYTSNSCLSTTNEVRQTLAACFNPQGTRLLTAGADPQLIVYDVATMKKERVLEPRYVATWTYSRLIVI